MVGAGPQPQDAAIGNLVGRFYGQVRQDPVLAPVFLAAIGETNTAWAAHLDRITDFWSSIMHGSERYHGDPFSAHLRLPGLQPAMFERWLALFRAACDEVLDPDLAAAFSGKADRIACSLQVGLSVRSRERTAHDPASPSPGPPIG